MSQVTHLYKIGRKVHAYIEVSDDGHAWHVSTGKPSDFSCLSWGPFATKEQAEAQARKYMNNYCATPMGIMPYKVTEYAACRFFGDVKKDIEKKMEAQHG